MTRTHTFADISDEERVPAASGRGFEGGGGFFAKCNGGATMPQPPARPRDPPKERERQGNWCSITILLIHHKKGIFIN